MERLCRTASGETFVVGKPLRQLGFVANTTTRRSGLNKTMEDKVYERTAVLLHRSRHFVWNTT